MVLTLHGPDQSVSCLNRHSPNFRQEDRGLGHLKESVRRRGPTTVRRPKPLDSSLPVVEVVGCLPWIREGPRYSSSWGKVCHSWGRTTRVCNHSVFPGLPKPGRGSTVYLSDSGPFPSQTGTNVPSGPVSVQRSRERWGRLGNISSVLMRNCM